MTIPRHLPYAKYDSDGSVHCVTDEWDGVGEYDATWHFHMMNVYPDWEWVDEGLNFQSLKLIILEIEGA